MEETSFKFLLQAIKILTDENITDKELDRVYEFLISIDNNELNVYYSGFTIISYSNDLELYMETISKVIKLYEVKEKYEQCHELKMKYDESEKILKNLK